MLAAGGLMAIETGTAGVTVRSVDAETAPEVALISAVPVPALEASPALLIVAVERVSEAHVTAEVMFIVLLSVNVPVAVNCCVVPSAIEGLAGVIVIEASAAAETLSVVAPVMPAEVALIVAAPALPVVTRPCDPPTLLICAMVGTLDVHCTVCVRFCVLLSLKVPVAVNCCDTPSGIVGIAGVTVIDIKTAGVMFTVVEPDTEPRVATMALFPIARLLTSPAGFTVATFVLTLLQLTELARFSVLPSL
jgi:hypothetical protein